MTTTIKTVLMLSAATLFGFAGSANAADQANLGDASYRLEFQSSQPSKTKADVQTQLKNHRMSISGISEGGDGTALPAWMSGKPQLSRQEVANQLSAPLVNNHNQNN